MKVTWFPDPPCPSTGTDELAFAVFRRRDGALRWQQISPLFNCWHCAPSPMEFRDRDVQEDHWYTYTLLRLDAVGEFLRQHGPSPTTCFDTAAGGSCPLPEPD